MTKFFQIAGPIASTIAVLLTIWQAHLLRKNHHLKSRLRRALYDLLAFYELEHRLCNELEVHRSVSANSIKRFYRAEIREDGMQSPSEDATPQRISQELERLGE